MNNIARQLVPIRKKLDKVPVLVKAEVSPNHVKHTEDENCVLICMIKTLIFELEQLVQHKNTPQSKHTEN